MRRCILGLIQPIINRLLPSSLQARFLKGAFWSLVGSMFAGLIMLLVSIPVGRLLGPHEYGKLGVVQSTLTMFAAFAAPGLGLTATKYMAEWRSTEPERAGRIFALSVVVAVCVGSALSALLWLAAPLIASRMLAAADLSDVLRLASVALLLNSLIGVQIGALCGLEAFRAVAEVKLWRGLASLPVIVIGAWLWGLMGVVIGLVAGSAFAVFVNQLKLRRELKKARVPISYNDFLGEWRVLLGFSLPAVLSGILFAGAIWLANAMLVNQLDGHTEMGIFNAADQWRLGLLFLPNVLNQTRLPILAEMYGRRSWQSFWHLLKFNLLIVFVATSILACSVALGSPWIMRAYGPGFSDSWLVLILLVFTSVLSGLIGVFGSAIASMGKMWGALALNCVWGVLLLVVFSVARGWGALGLAIAYLLSYVVHLVNASSYVLISLRRKLR